VRALLDLMQEMPESEEGAPVVPAAQLLGLARQHLTILDPEVGEEELIKAVAAEVAKLRALARSV